MTIIKMKMLQAAKRKAEKAPLVLWLQGGPGWSSAYGAFKEVDEDGDDHDDHDHEDDDRDVDNDYDHVSPGWPSATGAFKEVD